MASFLFQKHQIQYEIKGSGETLLFVHGWPTNAQLWAAQVVALQANYRVITFDWLGFGQSDKPLDHHYTFTKNKEILDALLKEILSANEQINLVAHDIGGPASILWAAENPARVKRLILLNTLTSAYTSWFEYLSHPAFILPGIKNILVSNFGLTCFLRVFTANNVAAVNDRIKAVLGRQENWNQKIKLKTILEPLEEGRKNELLTIRTKLEQLAVDKYLIIAQKDPLLYPHMKDLKNDNPDIPAFTIPQCSHFIPIDRPEELNAILFQILKPLA